MSEIAELLERFRRGGELIAVVSTGAAGSELDYHSEPGKWSIRQIVCHLADTELVTAIRFRAILSEDNPTVHAFDQNAWAEKLDYHKRKFSQTLESFRRLRSENHELIRELGEDAFARKAIHSKRGEMTLLDFLRLFTHHVESHAKQVQTVRELFKQSKVQ